METILSNFCLKTRQNKWLTQDHTTSSWQNQVNLVKDTQDPGSQSTASHFQQLKKIWLNSWVGMDDIVRRQEKL